MKFEVQQSQKRDPRDLNGDGRVSVWELWVSTGMVFVYMLAIAIVLVVAGYIFLASSSDVLRGLILIVGIPMMIACLMGISRQRQYEKAEKLAMAEHEYKLRKAELEIERLEHETKVFTGQTKEEQASQWNPQKRDYYVRLFLQRYYDDGKLSRDDWERDGLPQDAWNRANDLVRKAGIRKGKKKTLEYPHLAGAWGAYCDYLIKNRSWVNVEGTMVRH